MSIDCICPQLLGRALSLQILRSPAAPLKLAHVCGQAHSDTAAFDTVKTNIFECSGTGRVSPVSPITRSFSQTLEPTGQVRKPPAVCPKVRVAAAATAEIRPAISETRNLRPSASHALQPPRRMDVRLKSGGGRAFWGRTRRCFARVRQAEASEPANSRFVVSPRISCLSSISVSVTAGNELDELDTICDPDCVRIRGAQNCGRSGACVVQKRSPVSIAAF